jgi:hypothetical protein
MITDVNPTDRQEYQSRVKGRILSPLNNFSAFAPTRPAIPARTAKKIIAANSRTPKPPDFTPKPIIPMALSAKLTGIEI